MDSLAQTLSQLESARSLALGDGRYYPTIIPGVLPIIGANSNASLEIRRWGADFLAETFASPIWPPDAKEAAAMAVLDTLREYLDVVQDRGVIKSAVQAAATIYPLVYRHTVADPNDSHHWQLMLAIKSNILRRMDTAPSGVRICCVKFMQQVVLVQTPGVLDPRRPDQSDISLALLPRDHPLIQYMSMEAEGQGLLDRLLDILQGDHRSDRPAADMGAHLTRTSDALLVTAVLNSLGMLIQRRPAIASKILNNVLNFNSLKLANSPMTPKNKVIMKSIERTTRALLINVMKRNPENPNNARIQQYLERMHRMRLDVFDESNRKRPAPSEPTDSLDAAKRQRLGAGVPNGPPPVPDLPAGPVSYRQLFTLDPNVNTANFDVQMFQDPEQLLRILVPILQSIDATNLGQAINSVRSRCLALSKATTRPAAADGIDDEDEYEPDFEPEDAEQAVNRLDSLPPTDGPSAPPAPLAPYKLPEAPPLTEDEVHKYGDMTVRRAFRMLGGVEEKEKSKGTKAGFNRLAASDYGRDAWITILSRLATRASAGLDDPDEGVKDKYAVKHVKGSFSISDAVRDGMYQYIMYDWKKRIDTAICWLNEEWYNDTILSESAKIASKANSINGNSGSLVANPPKSHYHRCTLRLLDGILPYVEHTDKVLLRFLSEIPAVDYEILMRMKTMAEDPERIELACMVLQYLYMFRPPVRSIVIDVMSELWRENDRAKPSAKKLLLRWKPEVLQEDSNGAGEGGAVMKTDAERPGENAGVNGTLEVKAAS